MKKGIATIVLTLLFWGNSFAEVPFRVERFEEWGQDGLTITSTFNHHYYTTDQGAPSLLVYDVIRGVNGESVEGLTAEDFYALLKPSNPITLTVERKQNGQNSRFQTTYRPIAGLERVKRLSMEGGAEIAREVAVSMQSNAAIQHTALACDLFDKNTFDLNIEAEELGADSLILNLFVDKLTALGLVRDRKNPELILSVVLDKNERIEASYRPLERGERYTSKGPRWFGSRYRDMLAENPYILQVLDGQDQGFYLEITLLEGKRLMAGPSTPPILWQYRYTVAERPSTEQLLQQLDYTIEFPISGVILGSYPDLFTGLEFTEEISKDGKDRGYRVELVVEGSRAATMGFREGDMLTAFITTSTDKLWWGAKTKLLSENISLHKKYYNKDPFKAYQFYYIAKYNGKYVIQDFADEYCRHLMTTSGRFNYRKALYQRSHNSPYGTEKHLDHQGFSINFHEEGEYEVSRGGETVKLPGQLFPTRYRLNLPPNQQVKALIRVR